MNRQTMTPVQTTTAGDDPGPPVLPSTADRLDALAAAVEVALDPAAPAATRDAVLEKLRLSREKRERPERPAAPQGGSPR